MENAFVSCYSLTINAIDVPDLSQVTNMSGMFMNCTSLNQSINNWDVSNVTDMSYMFLSSDNYPHNFNQPLDNWDVSNVTNMEGMFYGSESFNQPLNNWDVSSVTNMSQMFNTTLAFNQSLNNWNVSNVTDMSDMFFNNPVFNQSLNNWDTSAVINFRGMFFGTHQFDQPLTNWNVSNATNMANMFADSAFNQSLEDWDVSNVTDMASMFSGSAFNQPIESWDVSNVTDMRYMFSGCEAFNQPLNNWNVSAVTNFNSMFERASSFNQPLNNWDVSNASHMSGMFINCAFNQPLNNWNTQNVIYMSLMFKGNIVFNQDLNDWDISSVIDLSSMFDEAFAFNQPLSNWDVSNTLNMRNMFRNATTFNQDLSNWDFNSDVDLGDMSTFDSANSFIGLSALDTNNYDSLLLRFAQLELENKVLKSVHLFYCNSGVRNHLINELGWTILGDILSPTCQGNNIAGSVIYDENANGCDTEDALTGNFLVTANDGEFTYSTISSDGEYDLRVMEGSYTVSLLNVPDYFTVNPATAEVGFTGFGNNEELNFCLTANEAINDLNITIIPVNEARPGFESHYQLVAENIGTQTITGAAASFTYNETIQEFVNASQTPASTTANQITFDLGTMLPLESKIIDITMETFTPPTVNGGETINFVATITPDANDNTPADNTYNFDQVVVNSFDPNDKTILQGDEIYMEQTEGYLDYVIRFQNTGTASAITVRIEDVLHDNLDWTTFKPVSSSHDYRVEITDGNQVEFIFDNINLPHEAVDEPGSHGFVAYKIKAIEDIAIGDVITGTAGIFFDYNLPIITNSADTEVVEFMGVNEFSIKNVTLYPNPASTILYLQAENGIDVEEVKVFNLQGSELISLKQQTESINVQNLSAGIYLVIVQTNEGVSKHRLIKK